MSASDSYRHMEAFTESDRIEKTMDGLCRPVIVMMVGDTGEGESAACPLGVHQARNLAFELLVCAEHAERLTHGREAGR